MEVSSSASRSLNNSSTSLNRHMIESPSIPGSNGLSNILTASEAKDELEVRIKILLSYFSNNKDYIDAVDHGNFKTPDKRLSSISSFNGSLYHIFGNATTSVLISDYCDLLVKEAVYAQPYFQSDTMLLTYLKTKICSPIAEREDKIIVTIQIMEEFLAYKRNEKKSEKAKMKAQLLIDAYHVQMRMCVQNWASLYFNPSLRSSMNASITKQLWRRNKDSSIGKLLVSQHCSGSNLPDTIFGMPIALA